MERAAGGRRLAPLALSGGVIADGEGLFLPDGGLLVREGRIERIGSSDAIRAEAKKVPGVQSFELKGRIVLPGFLNPHHHLYSSLAVGLKPPSPPAGFLEQLERHWWRLDAALDEEAIALSALKGVVESVKCGVTAIFDHHASMGRVHGSLELVAEAFRLAGIQGLLCFESSERGGAGPVEEHFRENLDFWERHRDAGRIKGAFGLHAGLTLSEACLKRAAELKPGKMPIHIHCGEDRADLELSVRLGYQGPVHRLQVFGLLSPEAVLAHALHLSEADYRLLEEVGPVVVCNPESNANNRVGRMDRSRIRRYLLGTDGMTSDMLLTLRSHYLLAAGQGPGSEAGGPPPLDMEELSACFFSHKRDVQERFFPGSGPLKEGSPADLAVLDYTPPTPIDPENLMAHLLFGAGRGPMYMTVADGAVIYREGRILFLDEEDLARRARKAAVRLWERYYA